VVTSSGPYVVVVRHRVTKIGVREEAEEKSRLTNVRVGGQKKEKETKSTQSCKAVFHLYHVFRDRIFQMDVLWWISIAVQDDLYIETA